jgi:thioredoxin reductase (NADPH)
LQSGEKTRLEVAGMFYGIGHQPNSGLIKEYVEVDEKGYVKVRGGQVARSLVEQCNGGMGSVPSSQL